jgi:hypothetical protein
MSQQESQEFAVALLHRAGITQTVLSVQAITDKGITNQMSLLTLQNGERFILRRYRWPWTDRDHNRLHKEKFLHRLLQRADVPVPAILADVELAGQSAVLMEGRQMRPGRSGQVVSSCIMLDRIAGSLLMAVTLVHSLSTPAT